MEDEFKHLVRISRKDVNGNKTIEQALTEIKGVGISLSKTMCRTLDLDLESKIGYIADEDVLRIEEILENPQKFDIPSWMLNRREDYETGDDIHLIESDLDMTLRWKRPEVTKVEDTKLVYLLEVKEPNLLSEKVLQLV